MEELALAAARPPLGGVDFRVLTPALSTGEVGAAAGVLSLAVLAFFMAHDELASPALAAFLSEGAARGAALVTPTGVR
jgi:hypothetical protein